MSTHWYYLNLEEKLERMDTAFVTNTPQPEERPVGSLLVAFLETDWTSLLREADALFETMSHRVWDGESGCLQFAALYQNIRARFEGDHPLLHVMACGQLLGRLKSLILGDGLTPEGALEFMALLEGTGPASACGAWFAGRQTEDILRAMLQDMKQYVYEYAKFSETMDKVVWRTMEPQGEHHDLPVLLRYYTYRQSGIEYETLASQRYPALSVEPRISYSGPEPLPCSINWDALSPATVKSWGTQLQTCTYQASNDLCALVLLEYDYMVAHELIIRKCENCGHYFLPFSAVSRYCGRPLEAGSGKTCKDVAAAQKYMERVNQDAAKRLYRALNNRFQMQASRRAASSRTARPDYQRWQQRAKELLEQYQAGELEFEAFKREINVEPAALHIQS